MILTEVQAKIKLCPFTFSNPTEGTHCEASSCMIWRWIDKRKIYPDKLDRPKGMIGYCGIAGKPEVLS